MTYIAPEEVQTTRIRFGLCPTCGIQTQAINKNGNITAITNPSVHNSRCLLCNPLPKFYYPSETSCSISTSSSPSTSSLPSIRSFPSDVSAGRGTVMPSHFKSQNFQQQRFSLPENIVEIKPKNRISHNSKDVLFSQSVELNSVTKSTNKNHGILRNRIPTSGELFQEGWDYLMGDNYTPIDKVVGESLITNAMRHGSVAAKGFCFFLGWGGHTKDYSEALKWFSLGIRTEKSIAVFLAIKGYFYLNGFGVKIDMKTGISLIERAVILNHAWSQNMLGFCYQKGQGVGKNILKARNLYKLAAMKGYCKAQYNLGELYLGPEEIRTNREEGLKWLIKAAQQGHFKARERLGWLD